MRKLALTLTILVAFIQNTEADDVLAICGGKTLRKIGCYQKAGQQNNGKLPFNDLVVGRETIEWRSYHESLERIICRCSKAAIEKGYNVIGIQYYGECWGANKTTKAFDSLGTSDGCINGDFHSCNKDDEVCAGKDRSTLVYSLNLNTETSEGKLKIDGGFNEWSPWSPCKCYRGFKSRHRLCIKPKEGCSGDRGQTQSCTCKQEKIEYVFKGCGKYSQKETYTDVLLSSSPKLRNPKPFCIVRPTKDSKRNPYDYSVSVDVYSALNKKAGIGIIFNARDDKNYEFAYINIKNDAECYKMGRVVNGKIRWNNSKKSSCSKRFRSQQWVHLKLEVLDSRKRFYANNVLLVEWNTHTKNTGKAGVLIKNPKYLGKDRSNVRFKNLKIE